MTAPTPEQIRALADEATNLECSVRVRAALRAAADQLEAAKSDAVAAGNRIADLLTYSVKLQDQLEAVRSVADYLRDERWDDPTFDPERRLRAILTADTAPQAASTTPRECSVCRGTGTHPMGGTHCPSCLGVGAELSSRPAHQEDRDDGIA